MKSCAILCTTALLLEMDFYIAAADEFKINTNYYPSVNFKQL